MGYGVKQQFRGSMDIHGQPRLSVWTKLNTTAFAGTSTIVTVDAVDYQAGEHIVITSTSNNFKQTEEVVVVSVDEDRHTVTFEPALIHTHESFFYTFEDTVVDMRCEVGLLSRNVVLQGDEDSMKQMYGMHTIGVGGGALRYVHW